MSNNLIKIQSLFKAALKYAEKNNLNPINGFQYQVAKHTLYVKSDMPGKFWGQYKENNIHTLNFDASFWNGKWQFNVSKVN